MYVCVFNLEKGKQYRGSLSLVQVMSACAIISGSSGGGQWNVVVVVVNSENEC